MKAIITLILLSCLLSSALSFNITCRFMTRPSDYTCIVRQITFSSPTDTIVTGVDGRHQAGKTAVDVKAFEARGKNLKRFPVDLNKFFTNLETIIIERGLTEIHKEELQGFPNLKKLYLASNEISVIEPDLFINNPNLELIHLGHNKISTVAPKVFDGLQKLAHLGFERNNCFNALVENNRDKVLKLIQHIYEKCGSVATTTAATSTGTSTTSASVSTTSASTTTTTASG